MKEFIVLICFLFTATICFAQNRPIVNRANSSYTVQDASFSAQLNMYVPKYSDTTQANLATNIGNDSCSAVIYLYSTNTLWYRSCAGGVKAWVEIGAGGGSGITIGSTTITSGTNTRVLFNNSGVVGEYTISGTGSVAMTASPTFTGTITTPLTASRAVVTGASSELAASATTATELGFVSGLTSNAQTQIDGKWGLTGNAGTVAGTNFIGTTDAIDMVIKTGGTERAKFVNSTGALLLGNNAAGPTDVAFQVYKASNPKLSIYNGTQFTNIFTGTALSIFQFPVAGKFGIQAATSINDAGTTGVYPLIAFGSGNSHSVLVGGVAFSATPNARLDVRGSLATQYTATATSLTADITHSTINVTATGQTITLPTAVGISGRIYTIKLTASGSGTVATTSSQTIDGSTTYSLSAQYKYVTVVSDGANYIIIGNN